jgi:hypothetical protein
MTVDGAVNFEEIARSTEDFNGAQLKAVCVEAVSRICHIFLLVLVLLAGPFPTELPSLCSFAGHVGHAPRCDHRQSRGLCGRCRAGSGKEEGQPAVLSVK